MEQRNHLGPGGAVRPRPVYQDHVRYLGHFRSPSDSFPRNWRARGNPISVAILINVVKDTISDALTESGRPLGSGPAKRRITTRGGGCEVDAPRALEDQN